MKIASFDTETELIRPGTNAPELVCVSYLVDGELGLLGACDGIAAFERWLDEERLIVGQNTAFDMAVMCAAAPRLIPKVFKAYDENRVTCTMLRQQLIDIGLGCFRGRMGSDGKWITYKYSLDDLSYRFRGARLEKDSWRMFYGAFRGVPLSEWEEHAKSVAPFIHHDRAVDYWTARYGFTDPQWLKAAKTLTPNPDPRGVLTYPKEDAQATDDIYWAQERNDPRFLVDQYNQARYYFALRLAECWGLRTSAAAVDKLEEDVAKEYERLKEQLTEAGLVRPNGTRDTKAAIAHMIAVCDAQGIPIRKTAGGDPSNPKSKGPQPCLDSDACKATEDPLLEAYADFSTYSKVQSTDVEMLRKGVCQPIHCRFGLADTGRTTCSSPNLQNLRRFPGIRECIVPREGYVFAQADYPQLELYTLAESCYRLVGFSELGEALKAGLDPHLALAAQILGISYEEAKANKKRHDVDMARQTAKVANFGFPGGLGPKRLVHFAWKSYKVVITEEQARELRAQWLKRWPEMLLYFQHISDRQTDEGISIVQLVSNRVRSGCSFTAACNSNFQGLGSDIAKTAFYEVVKRCYVETPGSHLFGSRPVNMVHDEIITETPDTPLACRVSIEVSQIMVDVANRFLENVPLDFAKMDPTLMRVWSKQAFDVYNLPGDLVPWDASDWVYDEHGSPIGLAPGAEQWYKKDGKAWNYAND